MKHFIHCFNEFSKLLGYVVVLVILMGYFVMSVIYIAYGYETSKTLQECELKYKRQCEIIANVRE